MTTLTVRDVQAGPPQTTTPVSASAPSGPDGRVCAVMIGLVGVAGTLSWFMYHDWVKPGVIAITAGYVPFAGIVVVSSALERLLEPISDWVEPRPSPA